MMNTISDDDDNNINLKLLPDLHPYSDKKVKAHEDEEEVAHGVDQLEELNVDVNFVAIDVNDQLEELN
ncbi:hypothetical protein QVD17_39838 [Tagetes erecta]|uniref:Uncharacterized protein n=1 Tax=Tagetes erecta TaxID=13708 RepID=A0AAD8JQT2_TARER|nr:hypothetical protein QVD17_39838 [Tagetes erecta]